MQENLLTCVQNRQQQKIQNYTQACKLQLEKQYNLKIATYLMYRNPVRQFIHIWFHYN